MNNRYAAYIGVLAAVSAGVLWGFLGPAVRYCMEIGLTPMQMTWLRYIVVTLILLIYAFVFKRDELKTNHFQIGIFIVMAVVGVMLNSTLYFQSMLMIPLSMSTVLQYLAPFIVIALSIPLFREKASKTKIAAVITAFIGCILCTGLITEPGSMNIEGIALGALSGFCYATYILCSKRLSRDGCTPTTILLYTSIICTICFIPICDAPGAISVVGSSLSNLMIIILFGILLTLVPFWLFNYSLEKIDAGKSSIITFVEPLVATLLGFVIYGETLTVEAVIGMVMIASALIMVSRNVPSGEDPNGVS